MVACLRIVILCFLLVSPVRAEFSYQFLYHSNDVKIRIGEWKADQSKKFQKLLVICPGRASFIEKNDRLSEAFFNQGFRVIVIDWQGQGGSDRLVDNPQKVYINDYSAYVKDIQKTLKTYHTPDQKVYLLGSSMGALAVMCFLGEQDAHNHFSIQAAILLAPMLGMKTKPFPNFLARWLATGAVNLGYQDAYCYGYGDFDFTKDVFERNRNTHSRENFERQKKITQDHRRFLTAGPTYGWLKASFIALDKVHDPQFIQTIVIPIFIATAGDDQTVDTSYDAQVATNLKHVTHKVYAGAWHNIFNETDDIRQQLLKDIEEFLIAFQG